MSRITLNGFAVDAGDAGNLSLWGVALQQRDDSGALVGFQDIHSLAFLRGRPEHASCQQVPTVSALRPCPRSIQVGEFEVAISGGVWVAAGGLAQAAPALPTGPAPKIRMFSPTT